MDTLSVLINLLDDTDKIEFLAYLQKKNRRNDVKNILLFQLLKTDDINGKEKMYREAKNKDAYHALRKRLQDSLLLYLSQKTFERGNTEAYEALRWLVVSRFLLENSQVKIALKCLAKAEKIAQELEQFSLLNEILLLRLQFSHLSGVSENPGELTGRLLSNQQQLQQEARLNIAYAFLRQELQDVHLKGKIVNLSKLIAKTVKDHQLDVRDLMTYKSLYQVLFIANEFAAIQQDYTLIEPYIRRSLSFIRNRAEATSYHLFYHLHILYYLANFNLRNKAFTDSIRYLRQMEALMEEHRRYGRVFYLRHCMLLALNQHFLGEAQQAAVLLQEALGKANKKSKQEDLDDVQLCLTMFLAQQNNASCLKLLAKFTHSDAWYEQKMGMLWTIRKNLMEILIRIQFEHIDLGASRLKSFRRRYRSYLMEVREERVMAFVSLIEKYVSKPDVAFEPDFQQAVLGMLGSEVNNDIFNLSFIAWLIARWEKKTPYQVMLRMVK